MTEKPSTESASHDPALLDPVLLDRARSEVPLDDVAISAACRLRPIRAIAAGLGISDDELLPYGHDKAKVSLTVLQRPRHQERPARLVLVSAITPTPAGEGKTTTTIGVGQALGRLGERVVLALREPSLGPCMGVKGGAAGGGWSQIGPAVQINLHFTGDFHAITSAHNLLAATLDNHLHHGNALDIDPQRVMWRRVLDMNDRSLRNVIIGLGGPTQGTPRETGFDITAASEIMAMLCLAESFEDLRARLDRTLVAMTRSGEPVTAGQLGVTGALLALLHDAIQPNLVQTLEGQPVIVHGGPFANIAHGCNSVLATRMAMHLGDIVLTEAGFGFDLGAEKFFDIKARMAGLPVHATLLVATVRALKMHGGVAKDALRQPDVEALRRGLANLDAHLDNAEKFGVPAVVAVNRFADDSDEEVAAILDHCAARGVRAAPSEHFAKGGAGALEVARALLQATDGHDGSYSPVYPLDAPVADKIEAIARTIYGADGIVLSAKARRDVRDIAALGLSDLPICIAKTQNSLSDNPKLRGRPTGFEVKVERILPNAGAGFLVVITGEIMRMPGLPKVPAAEKIDVRDGAIVGLT
ncbi:MAG: formate--tetrahydrofolate ligase [Deltaproteobacteria bacterium]|nr:formate--tetrahydrofolate ligase [Deltaproteobacteria bacterium]